jgi:hypothetical protein
VTLISSSPSVVITVVPIVTPVAAKEIEDDRPLALGATGVGLREHDIHEAAWTSCKDHGRGLWAALLIF